MSYPFPRLVVVVGSGGVGKTTLAAALALGSAADGADTLVMTFDPSLRLKDALGVGEEEARDRAVRVPAGTAGRLEASLLDARRTFDRLVTRYAPDATARRRILGNRYYRHLAGGLAGILEYMAVERLFEVARSAEYDRVILDTPPTRQALDFLEAPRRIIDFLDSGALRIALRPWFDAEGRLRPTRRLGRLGRRLERFLDDVVGLDLLRDMAEFFQAFAPLYEGFRQRAREVERLMVAPETLFVLVAGPGEDKIPDALFFGRRLEETGHRLGPIVVNRLHPRLDPERGSTRPGAGEGIRLLSWLGERDHRGLERLRELAGDRRPVVGMPLMRREPADLDSLAEVARLLEEQLGAASG